VERAQGDNVRVAVTFRRVCVIAVAVGKQQALHVASVCKAQVSYNIVVCGLSDCITLFTLSYKRRDFRKKVIEQINVFSFLGAFAKL
jgi:hypothetical protein